ncbi:MAG TPA: hypothetical protein VLA99_00035 [Nitrospiraceae bacterium]|nr:hypothetical protein [Nitrospiraceae bacterium]
MQRTKRVALIGLGAIAAVAVLLPLVCETLLRRAVEDIGSGLTKTPVQLRQVDLSLFSGRLVLKDLSVGNPPEYQAPVALSVRAIRVSIDWPSLLRRPVLIREIVIERPEVTLEGSPTRNNLTTLRDQVQATTNDSSPGPASKGSRPSRKGELAPVIVTRLRIVDTRLNMLLRAGSVETNVRGVSLREITLKDLGSAAHTTSFGDITAQILAALAAEVTGAVAKSGTGMIEETGKTAGRSLSEAVEGVKGLFK